MAMAQVVVGTPTRAIQTASPGYCFTDLNDNDTVDLNEINVADGTEAMTDDTVPPRDAVSTGGRLISPSEIHLDDNWANITTQGDYTIDIAGICIGGISRTDQVLTDFDDSETPNGEIDRANVESTRTEVSADENYFDDDGFTFVGGSASDEQRINFSGQVRGDIEAVANASNIIFDLTAAVEIDGLLNLGNSISNAVLTLAGQIDEVDLDGASNFRLTSTSSIGDTADSATDYVSATLGTLGLAGATDGNITLQSGAFADIDLSGASNINLNNAASGASIDATNITNGIAFINTGNVSNIDFTGSDEVTADLNAGSIIGTLRARKVPMMEPAFKSAVTSSEPVKSMLLTLPVLMKAMPLVILVASMDAPDAALLRLMLDAPLKSISAKAPDWSVMLPSVAPAKPNVPSVAET